ncbi:MAG: glycosyltransferase family 39 protein [Candidatus Krumholzibacteriia bacterium]
MTRRSYARPLVGALLLLAGYLAVAHRYGDFALPTGADYEALHRTLGLDRRLIRDLAPPLLAGAVAKLLLLAPASALIAWCLAPLMPGRWLDRGAGLLDRPRHRAPLAAVTLLLAGLMVFWALVVLQQQPVYDDEFTYLFEAQTLGSGRLVAPAPPAPECFENVFIILRDGIWAGKYTSGHPLILALSAALGWVRLLPILLASLVPWLTYLIAVEVHDRRTGLLAAGLFVLSPFFIVLSSSLMNHGTCLFCLAVFTLGYLRARARRRWMWGVLAGLALGLAFNIRPQSAVAVGLPFAAWSLLRLRERGERRALLAAGLAVVLGFLPGLVYAGYYNHAVTGSWHRFPFMLLEDPRPPLSAFLGRGPGHTLWTGLGYDLLNVWRLNLALFGWGASLVPVAVWLWRDRRTAHDRVWLGVAGVLFAIYAGFPSPGVLELGPRYLAPLLIPLMIWSARGLLLLHELAIGRGWPRALVPAFVAVSVVLALVTFTREQARNLHQITTEVARPYRFVEARGLHRAIVLVRAKPPSGWVFGLRNNHPDLDRNDVIYIKLTGLGPVLALADALPDRQVYVLAFDPDHPAAEPELVPFTRDQLEAIRQTWR